MKIAPLTANDHAQWLALFKQYQAFYRHMLPKEIVELTWKKLLSPNSLIHGVAAKIGDDMVGFAHFLYHDSTWNPKPSCYLEDLFVVKSARGMGAGKKLIKEVEKIAKEQGAFRLYLHTQAFNSSARSLYDSVLPLSSFIVYRKKI